MFPGLFISVSCESLEHVSFFPHDVAHVLPRYLSVIVDVALDFSGHRLGREVESTLGLMAYFSDSLIHLVGMIALLLAAYRYWHSEVDVVDELLDFWVADLAPKAYLSDCLLTVQ